MFWTIKIQKNVLILIGIISLSYVIIFLLSPVDIADYMIVDTQYWRDTENRLSLRSIYDYNDKNNMLSFPKNIGEWKGTDYKYPEFVYKILNADILISRGYRNNKNIIWMDIIDSKTGESFHNQKICVKGSGWNVDNESIEEFNVSNPPYLFTKLYANRLDVSKGDKKQIIVYWFMSKKFGSDNSVTMARLSVPVKNNDTDTSSNILRNFIEEQLFYTMYSDMKIEQTSAEHIVEKYGTKGIMLMTTILLVPIGIIFKGVKSKK